MGCWALQNLMRDSEINHVAVIASGGIQLVLGAMEAYPGDVAVVQHGCGALGGMAYDGNSQANVVAANGAEAVVAAMRAHRGVLGVQVQGCFALEQAPRGTALLKSLPCSAHAPPFSWCEC